ncbi:MAG: hypothetical protein QME96_05865 [Myxococcota bacterium]|nr:hypothetical protein [Myxococcota bacterium]
MSVRIEPCDGPGDRDGYLVQTPFHEGFIHDLKDQVPPSHRRWWDTSKAWWVDAECEDLLTDLLLRYFDGFERVDADTGEVEYVGRGGARARQGGLFG